MPRTSPRPKRLVPALPRMEREQQLKTMLDILDRHPDLVPFRLAVPPGPMRQAALFQALLRSALPDEGTQPADPEQEQFLRDILGVIDTHPDLKHIASAYGPGRHAAILQGLGIWPGAPQWDEFFATQKQHLTTDATSTSLAPPPDSSPLSQITGSNGEQVPPPPAPGHSPDQPVQAAQVQPQMELATTPSSQGPTSALGLQTGIIRHAGPQPGELSSEAFPTSRSEPQTVQCQITLLGSGAHNPSSEQPDEPFDLSQIPPRPVRMGRPPALDELAKGRLLGLMAYGLSFRQAAAQLGVHHQTLLNLMKRDESFAQQVAEARLDAISQPLLTVVRASRTNWRAAAWLAKHLDDRRGRIYEQTPEEQKLERLMTD